MENYALLVELSSSSTDATVGLMTTFQQWGFSVRNPATVKGKGKEQDGTGNVK